MTSRVQYVLDNFYYARKAASTFVVYMTLRLYGVEVAFSDVKDGTFRNRKHNPLNLDDANDIDTLLNLSDANLASADQRRANVADKCKTLFTFGSLLLGVIGLLLPKYLAFGSVWMKGLALAAIALLFNAIVVMLAFFDVGVEMDVSLDQDDVPLDEKNLKKSIVNRNLQCEVSTQNRTDYLVNVYQATRFCLCSATTIVAGLVLYSLLMANPDDTTERIVRELRSDPKLIDLLRGPGGAEGKSGQTGNPGPVGPIGPRGETGSQGKPGDAPSIDDVLSRLLSDKRLSEAIRRAVASMDSTTSPATAP